MLCLPAQPQAELQSPRSRGLELDHQDAIHLLDVSDQGDELGEQIGHYLLGVKRRCRLTWVRVAVADPHFSL